MTVVGNCEAIHRRMWIVEKCRFGKSGGNPLRATDRGEGMTFIRIKEQVDHISETWRDGTPEELRTHLADLDTALSALEELETDSPDMTDLIDELRGRVEVLMDEIDISLGIELPALIEMPDEFNDLQPVGAASDDDEWEEH